VGGPGRIRVSLGEASDFTGDVGDDAIHVALDHKARVEAIADVEVRRALCLAMDTKHCRERATVRDVAEAMGVPVARAHRLIRKGLEALRYDFARREAA
ncbi:MAG: hypothetical protein JSS20_22330, partial [Proteobacteria bacterium]|nr:hypothetical protein [Pseudomonadota bacterium]